MQSVLYSFPTIDSLTLEEAVYIKKFKEKQYLVISHLTFELNTDCPSPFFSTCFPADEYYVHPDTLQCGYLLNAFAHDALTSSYFFDTLDHMFREARLDVIHKKIKDAKYLRIGRIVIRDKPYSKELSEKDIVTIRQALNWLIKKSNEKNNKRKIEDIWVPCCYSSNKKPKIDDSDEPEDFNDKFFDKMMTKPNFYDEFKSRIEKEKVKEGEIFNILELFNPTSEDIHKECQIVNLRGKQYLVMPHVIFELNHNHEHRWTWNQDKFYIHPSTLQVGYVKYSLDCGGWGPMYEFKTRDHYLYETMYEYNISIYSKIQKAGYLEIGHPCIMEINTNTTDNELAVLTPYTQKLSKQDNDTIQETLKWLVEVSNKVN